MKNIINVCLLACTFNTFVTAQIVPEKVGLVFSAGTRMSEFQLDAETNKTIKNLGRANRLGGRISFGLNCRLSFETGLYADFGRHRFSQPSRSGALLGGAKGQFANGEYSYFAEHQYLNFTLPLTLTVRTFISGSCVTYARLSYNSIFNMIQQNNYQQSDPDIGLGYNNGLYGGRQLVKKASYQGSAVEFAFGNFWEVKSLNALFCIEPRVNIMTQQRGETSGSVYGAPFTENRLFLNGFGIELMLYKNLNS